MADETTTRPGAIDGVAGSEEPLGEEPTAQLVLACCPDLARLGERVALCGAPLVIGRAESLPLFPGGPLPGDRMSRRHASVIPAEVADAPTVRGGAETAPAMPLLRGRCLIEDLGSTNGTFLNGEKVTLLTSLGHGDVIRAGLALIVYTEEPVPDQWEEPAEFVGISAAAHRVRELLCRYAQSDSPVLIEGEGGTGMTVAARALHRLSGREGAGPVTVDCRAMPDGRWESHLFAHEGGVPGGTLYLDEIGEMPLASQARLLHFLETGEATPPGSRKPLTVSTRLVASSRHDLAEAARKGTFSEELLALITSLTLTLPPLRERRSDIPALFYQFLHRALEAKPLLSVSGVEMLMLHTWPQNVRELEAIVDLLVATRLADMDTLTLTREVVERLEDDLR